MSVQGMDVSKWQGVIDWSQVASSNIHFAIIRAGYGSNIDHVDTMFHTNIKNAKANGIPVGAYWYSYASTTAQAQAEARYFLEVVKGYQLEYPLYFDIEDNVQDPLTNEQRTDLCIAFCNVLQNAGYYAGIYANLYSFQHYFNLERLKPYDKWLAQWASAPSLGPEFGGMWQFSNNGSVNGISGRVDLDIAYKDYPAIIKAQKLNGFGTAIPEPAPDPITSYHVGDVVSFNKIYTSSDSTQALNPAITQGTITKVLAGKRNPYLINNGTGWVNDASIISTPVPTPRIQTGDIVRPLKAISYDGIALNPDVLNHDYPVIEVNGKRVVLGNGLNTAFNSDDVRIVSNTNALQVGTRVKIRQGAPDYNGTPLASFVYERVYTIIQLNGNRAVLSDINTAVNTDNLYAV